MWRSFPLFRKPIKCPLLLILINKINVDVNHRVISKSVTVMYKTQFFYKCEYEASAGMFPGSACVTPPLTWVFIPLCGT